MMDRPDINTVWACLARFETKQDPMVVVLAEGILANIFGTWNSEPHRRLRSPELPAVTWKHGLNQSDPLISRSDKLATIEILQNKRQRTLDKARTGGPMHITLPLKNGVPSYQFVIFQLKFRIPIATGRQWNLEFTRLVNVTIEISAAQHAHMYATKCDPGDDGCRVAIRVSKINDQLDHIYIQW